MAVKILIKKKNLRFVQVPAIVEGNEKDAEVDSLKSCDIREKVGEKEDSVE